MLRGLLFAAEGAGQRANEFSTNNPIGHHPLERTTNPVLILTNQIGRGLCLAHALRGFQRCMSPDMASLEPAIRKVFSIALRTLCFAGHFLALHIVDERKRAARERRPELLFAVSRRRMSADVGGALLDFCLSRNLGLRGKR
jgi:hypothetical protein